MELLCQKQFWDRKPVRDTVPLELNRKELQERDNTHSEMFLYGNLPLMVSAQCVHANAGADRGCDKMRTVTYLKDRYGKYFPVKITVRNVIIRFIIQLH